MREATQKPQAKHWIIGHSAGGQFVMRMSAFQDTGAVRLVAANPGNALLPTLDVPFGWQLAEAPGIGHDHQKMFDHANCAVALFGEPTEAPLAPQAK